MNKLDLYNSEKLDRLRGQQDPLADHAVSKLLIRPDIIESINSWDQIPDNFPKNFPKEINGFFNFYTEPFPFESQFSGLRHVQEIFFKHLTLMLSLLGLYALPYTYAFGNGAEVLVRSRRMVEDPGRRLAETALFILECYRPGAFLEDKRIFLVLAKVRLIHAFSRHFIQKYDNTWDFSWGPPINQEDMMATNLSFSLLIYRGMRKAGVNLGQSDKEALLQYWKCIGYYLGLNMDFLPDSPKEAFELEKMIKRRHLRASSAGKTLIKSLLHHYQNGLLQPAIAPFSADLMAYFLGKPISEVLDIDPKNQIPDFVLGAVMAFSLFGLGGKPKSFLEFYAQFRKNTAVKFGENVTIKLPERKH
ncbi:MAG: oxygenase MpaB family protein [Cyclobacteriaceae bacterium]